MKHLFVIAIALATSLLVLAPATAVADCSYSETCSLDGGMMMPEQTYYNGMHKSVKFSHHHWVGGKEEYHYVIVSCD
jgi:hypothetical protein